MSLKKIYTGYCLVFLSSAVFSLQSSAKETAHEHESVKAHDTAILLDRKQQQLANIRIETVNARKHIRTIYAPGEVKVNGYKSYVVSPRTDSVIINRHAILGQHVDVGQKLVTLFSEAMAQAQAEYLIASTEWQRVQKLDGKNISDSQRLRNEINFNAAYGKLIALGLTEQAIANISTVNTARLGQYSLIAKKSGVVLKDDFSQGQRIDAGETIMVLADEAQLWVEAKLSPTKELALDLGSVARVKLGQRGYLASIIQESHTIDPVTRTQIVRLSVNNKDDALHPGMFVDVNFQIETNEQLVAVPDEALIRKQDGSWIVYVEKQQGQFLATPVTLGSKFGELREVNGITSGSRVVTQGAFFVAAERMKSGFDPHNH
ncbi:efflux RND transporter periplasmic adaptor subunit [Thalassotalea sediminis]|uniref:efflux RND transporter periplasmic adaptor subunit n=1 Tax=Thalassotalea sediminis TaxID=1759089 RepID=UPI002572BFC4|nr:efflux RND transporter periplasmic adaptor subunit [Thalassotalea sediminis]